MQTRQDVIKGIQDIIANRTGRKHAASRWSERLLDFHLNNYRIRVLYEQRIAKKKPVSDFIIETIPCVPLIDVSEHECVCETTDKCVKKSKYPIPETITGNLEYVGSLNGYKYDYVKFENLGRASHSIFKGRRDKSFYSKKTIANKTYLYVLEDPHVEFVTVKLLPKDPLEILRLPDCNGKINKCINPLIEEFKIDGELLSYVYAYFAKEVLNMALSTGLDLDLDFQDGSGLNQRITKK